MGRSWDSRVVNAFLVLFVTLAVGLVAVAVRNADEADRRTLAASSLDATTSTTVAGTTPTSMGVPATTTTTTAPGGGVPATAVAGELDASDGLSLTGFGPVTVGMTVAEAEEAAGVTFGPATGPDPGDGSCTYVAVPGEQPLVQAMVIDGVVSRIDVSDGSPVETLSGIGIGATAQEVRDTYGERLVEEPHPYDEAGSQLRYVPDQPTHSLIFEIGGGVVTAFRSGFTEQVGYEEGCS